jgi:hypothetical protein
MKDEKRKIEFQELGVGGCVNLNELFRLLDPAKLKEIIEKSEQEARETIDGQNKLKEILKEKGNEKSNI